MANRDGPRPPRRRRRSSETSVYADDLLQNLNATNTVADLILNDEHSQKRHSIGIISQQSAIAKTILDSMDDSDSIRLNTVNTINVLKLMSDIFDNKIVIVNQ
jgi:hypothetical protein